MTYDPRSSSKPDITPTPRRRGWCPTARRAMMAEDGRLLRIRPPAGRLSTDGLDRVADIATRYGDGHILITRRAKLELRGIQDSEGAIAALDRAGLSSRVDAEWPDIVVSAADDLDENALERADVVYDRLTAALREQVPSTAALSAKFLLVIDGGGRTSLADVHADIRFEAIGEGLWRIGLAGDAQTGDVLGAIDEAEVPTAAIELMRWTGERGGLSSRVLPSGARTRDALAVGGVAGALSRLTAICIDAPGIAPARADAAQLGYHSGRWLGISFVFGRVSTHALRIVADEARAVSAGDDIRFMPDRSVLLARAGDDSRARLHAIGAIVDCHDPRAHIAACVGQGGCRRATTDVRADAVSMAEIAPSLIARGLGTRPIVHVSGCAKGCAYRRTAPITLVGRDRGYDIGLSSAPDDTPLWRGLSGPEVRERVARIENIVARVRYDHEDTAATLERLGGAAIDYLIEVDTIGE